MKNGDEICQCGHTREQHRSREIGDITYCRKCHCDHYTPYLKVVSVEGK